MNSTKCRTSCECTLTNYRYFSKEDKAFQLSATRERIFSYEYNISTVNNNFFNFAIVIIHP